MITRHSISAANSRFAIDLPAEVILADPLPSGVTPQSEFFVHNSTWAFMVAGKVLQSAKTGAANLIEVAAESTAVATKVAIVEITITVTGALMLLGAVFSAGDTRSREKNIAYSPSPAQLRCMANPYDLSSECAMVRIALSLIPFSDSWSPTPNGIRASATHNAPTLHAATSLPGSTTVTSEAEFMTEQLPKDVHWMPRDAIADAVLSGDYDTILISGQIGVGKSTLLTKIQHALEARQIPTLMAWHMSGHERLTPQAYSDRKGWLFLDESSAVTPAFVAKMRRLGLKVVYSFTTGGAVEPSNAIRPSLEDRIGDLVKVAGPRSKSFILAMDRDDIAAQLEARLAGQTWGLDPEGFQEAVDFINLHANKGVGPVRMIDQFLEGVIIKIAVSNYPRFLGKDYVDRIFRTSFSF